MRAGIKVTLLAAVVLVGLLFVFLNRSPKMIYQDRSIEYWFTQLPLSWPTGSGSSYFDSITFAGQTYGNSLNRSSTFEALDLFGTNAIPFVLAKLTGKDHAVERMSTRLLVRAGLKSPFRDADLERMQAETALARFQELPPQILTLLSNLRTNANPAVADAAGDILRSRNLHWGETSGFDEFFPWSLVKARTDDRRTWVDSPAMRTVRE